MPGDIMRGYLQAQARSQQEEQLAEEKKMQKLTESLNQLKMKQLGRQMERAAEDWKYQQRVRQEKEEAMLRLKESGIDIDRLLLGLKEPDLKIGTMPIAKGYGINPLTGRIEYTAPEARGIGRTNIPWFIGTPYEETFGKPTISEVTKGMETLYPKSPTYEQLEGPETVADSLWAGLIPRARRAEERPFFAGKERIAGLLTGLRPRGEEEPEIKLPDQLIQELERFGNFNEWYRSLPAQAQKELDAEPETVATIKKWYALSQ